MSVKTIYTCDKCGDQQQTPDQFWTVGVTANCATYSAERYVPGMSLQVCRKCLEGFGIHVRKKAVPDEQAPAVPTLEELILEIIQRCQGSS